MKQFAIACLVAGLAILMAGSAMAASIETLMMPGEVIQGHAKYEEDCIKCHERFRKVSQTKLCLDCHKKVAEDIEQKKGYHSRIKNIKNTECKTCHTDHIGRKGDIVQLNKATFDHKLTDFALKGAHINSKCVNCHKKEKKYREAPSRCIDCHEKADVHKGRLGKDCLKCHTETLWAKAKFDHDKTKLPLRGKHKTASCVSCHPNELYKNITTTCFGCHQVNDMHEGRFGKKCQDCHAEKGWNQMVFNHDKTKFKLTGGHKKANCLSCHPKGDIYKAEAGKKCFDCHKLDDEHKGRFGKDCQSCHSSVEWKKAKFDHDKTDFKLRSKHKKVDCQRCHQDVIPKKTKKKKTPARSCFACHQQDDIHKGKQGKQCASCHNESNWSDKIIFDHGLTKFPLIGLHAVLTCEECHVSAAYKDTKSECYSCHKKNDEHKLKLGTSCETCHNPNGWKHWSFDHDKQTDFKLDGKHKDVYCLDCHTQPTKKKLKTPSACGICHQKDDVHDRGFGMQCDRCHITKSFKELKLNF